MPVRKIRASWWVDFRAAGVRYRKRSPYNTKSGAKEYELVLRQRFARGEPVDGPVPEAESEQPIEKSFADFAEDWFGTYVVTNNKLSEQDTKRILLRRHLIPWFGQVKVAAITGADVERYKFAKRAAGLSAKTVNNHLAVLGKCLRTAAEWGVREAPPVLRTLRTQPPPFDFLELSDCARILSDRAEPDWNAMVRTALRTGMRLGELRALDWSAIDFDRNIITVRRSAWRGIIDATKTYAVRHLPMTPDLKDHLLPRRRGQGLAFPRSDGQPWNQSTAESALKRLCRRVGVRPIGWHVFRHTYASHLVAAGVPLTAVKELLGHAGITMTMRYAHLAPATLHDAVRALVSYEQRSLERHGQPAVNGHGWPPQSQTLPGSDFAQQRKEPGASGF